MRAALSRLAIQASAPVFAVAGVGARHAVQELRLHDELRLVDTPRAANVLLIAGPIPEALDEAVARVHDIMSHPRCTVWWPLGALPEHVPGGLAAPVLAAGDDPAPVIVAAHRELLAGVRPSDPPALPDVDPAPWRGLGPYEQGGSGMTGGVPYGRPMAQLAPDRDGLRLDELPVRVGPFFPRLPPGLTLEARMQGDVVQEAAVRLAPVEGARLPGGAPPVRATLRPFLRALAEPVAVAELEVARAREHLRWLADALAAHELAALGVRVLRLAARLGPGEADAIRRLERTLRRSQALGWATSGVGVAGPEELAGLDAGPVTRAAGVAEDLRADEPAYQALGFEPVAREAGDAAARWSVRLAEAAQSLNLAARAGDRQTEPTGRVESPRGRLEAGDAPTSRLLPLLPSLLADLEWGDAMATLASLDLDLEEIAAARQPVGETPG